MPYPKLNPTTMANNWASRMAASGNAWLAGINDPKQAPNANPAQNAANWQAGVANAAGTYQARISSAGYVQKWQNNAKAKVSSFTGAGQLDKGNYQAAAQNLVGMIQTALASLPAKGPKGENSQRATAFGQAMHAQKGKGKAQV